MKYLSNILIATIGFPLSNIFLCFIFYHTTRYYQHNIYLTICVTFAIIRCFLKPRREYCSYTEHSLDSRACAPVKLQFCFHSPMSTSRQGCNSIIKVSLTFLIPFHKRHAELEFVLPLRLAAVRLPEMRTIGTEGSRSPYLDY